MESRKIFPEIIRSFPKSGPRKTEGRSREKA